MFKRLLALITLFNSEYVFSEHNGFEKLGCTYFHLHMKAVFTAVLHECL